MLLVALTVPAMFTVPVLYMALVVPEMVLLYRLTVLPVLHETPLLVPEKETPKMSAMPF